MYALLTGSAIDKRAASSDFAAVCMDIKAGNGYIQIEETSRLASGIIPFPRRPLIKHTLGPRSRSSPRGDRFRRGRCAATQTSVAWRPPC